MRSLILGIDAGNHMCKVVGPYGVDKFRSNICGWFERNVKESFGTDDMEFVIGDRKGFAGTIALYEDEYGNGAMYGDTKAHDDTKIRVLLAINRYINKYCPSMGRVSIVVGQPIKRHKDDEKNRIKDMLLGRHTVEVNGKVRTFIIDRVGVAAEGSSAFWSSNKPDAQIRIIDYGSGTFNAATITNYRHINNASDTYNFGAETVNNKDDFESMAHGIIRNTTKLKWHKSDKVFICGGVAEKIAPFIVNHYPNAEILTPKLNIDGAIKIYSPVYANAVGFYEVARGAFS